MAPSDSWGFVAADDANAGPVLERWRRFDTNRGQLHWIGPAALPLRVTEDRMNHFGRALKMAFRHRWNVFACILTSLAVAVLWGGNLTAVWPVVDVIMNDSSLPEWVDQQIAASEREVADSKHWLGELKDLSKDDAEVVEEHVQTEIKRRQEAIEKIIDTAPEKGEWNDARIAERTRLLNTLKRLEKLRTASPKELRSKLAEEEQHAVSQIKLYEKRASQYRWVAPYAHRWLPTTPFDTLVLICIVVLVATLFKSIFKVWNSILVSRIGNQVSFDLRDDFYRQVLRLDMAHFTEQGRGDLMNRCTSDLGSVGQGVQRVFGQAHARAIESRRLPGDRGLRELAAVAAHDHHRAAGRLYDSLARQSAQADPQAGDAGALVDLRDAQRNPQRDETDQGLHDGSRRTAASSKSRRESSTGGR